MSERRIPKPAHIAAHARRELTKMEKRLAAGQFRGDPGPLQWAIACQRKLVSLADAAYDAAREDRERTRPNDSNREAEA